MAAIVALRAWEAVTEAVGRGAVADRLADTPRRPVNEATGIVVVATIRPVSGGLVNVAERSAVGREATAAAAPAAPRLPLKDAAGRGAVALIVPVVAEGPLTPPVRA